MSDSIKKLNRLKEKIDARKKEISRAEGALEEAERALKEKFGCKDIASARRLLKKLTKEEQEAKDAFENAMTEFEEKWSNELAN